MYFLQTQKKNILDKTGKKMAGKVSGKVKIFLLN
jgi:hypothetical protein